jgi:carboxypeptidase C (cathepsin A)
MEAIDGPYAAALNHYVRGELEYRSDLPYELLTMAVQPWSYKEFEGAHLYVADKLAAAMRANPHMRVHVACGYHDGATPYFAAEHTFAHLAIPGAAARQRGVPLLRGRPHDVRARAEPARAVGAAGPVRNG